MNNNANELYKIIIDNIPPGNWIRWAAFDMPKNGDNVKLTYYQNKPERRSDFWFSPVGRMVSIDLRLRGFDWTTSLCEIMHIHTEYNNEYEKLKNEITRLESRLAIKKEMLLNMMRCKNASR